jgi:prolyl-tRNA synthetase
VDAIMPNGKTLQIGTVHHLGDHFSRTFNITYEDKNGEQKFAQQTCYGISERSIAALISIHGDDRGLILPPAIASLQAVIVPITIGKRHEDVMTAAQKLSSDLTAAGFRVKLDTRDMRPGAKYYWWEIRGVPLRLELGPRDLDAGKVIAVKRTGEKTSIDLATVTAGITRVFDEITDTICVRAEENTKSHLCSAGSIDTLNTILDEGNVAVINWCQQRECGDTVETQTSASILGTDVRSPYVPAAAGTCIVCGKPGKPTLVGRAY